MDFEITVKGLTPGARVWKLSFVVTAQGTNSRLEFCFEFAQKVQDVKR
jgi:hypothetical protein